MRIQAVILAALLPLAVNAQSAGLTDTRHSANAKIYNLPLGATHWTGGFWGERFGVWSKRSIWDMWSTWKDPDVSHGFENFRIAAGDAKGEHAGAVFHDGDMYKWLEACAAVYAVTRDKKLDQMMDTFITEVAKAQRADGYIHTPVIIAERNKGIDTHNGKRQNAEGIEVGKDQKTAFASRLNFETYNLGHLMTAGVVHHRATGKTNLFDCAVKAADFLYNFLKTDRAGLARNAICPSHYMGAFEMYRETGDKRYLELGEELINIRDSVRNGEDHNQDRIPFRQQYEAMGHAVRANYLYAGVADMFAETGENQLMRNLSSIWDDIADHKIYITGGCGALYDGVSPDGTTYDQPSIQQIHQAYGRKYQLPQESSHNETCAQVGELLYSWRMFESTGMAKYAEMVEHELYNGIMPGQSIDGTKYFYTQALRKSEDFPYVLRWPKTRQKYISCFCCPPNTLRTLVEAQEYAYSEGKDGSLYVNLYGENHLCTKNIDIEQTTEYPYDGRITLKLNKLKGISTLRLRIPSWADNATLTVGGKALEVPATGPDYVSVDVSKLKKGTIVELNLPMEPQLMVANPLVEEATNQVAVMRGPLVYCLENVDVDANVGLSNVIIPANIKFKPVEKDIDGYKVVALEGNAYTSEGKWKDGQLYRKLDRSGLLGVDSREPECHISLIPYFAWDNRNEKEMTVWMKLGR